MPSLVHDVNTSLRESLRSFERWWRIIGRTDEIRGSNALLWSFGAVMLGYFLVFSVNMYDPSATRTAAENGSFVCWPYFQSCESLMFLETLPHGYSQMTLYMGLFGLLLVSAYMLSRGRYEIAHASLTLVWTWHAFATFVLAYPIFANHDYYIFSFATIILFFPRKEFFLKATIVLFYFLAASVKIHPGWIAGTLFTSLANGLPFVPDTLVPFLTNATIASQIFLPWLLFSRKAGVRLPVLALFSAFHLYSGIYVGYAFPTLILPIELILFGRFYTHQKIPFDRASVAGWAFLAFWCGAQMISPLIPGDVKLTMEGARFGQYMFEANHQCISTATTHFRFGGTSTTTISRHSHFDRCEPYRYWFRLKTECERDHGVERIEWTFDHSVNGGPFLRIVDVDDACALQYAPFRHNTWIATEADSPPIIGYPVQNFYD